MPQMNCPACRQLLKYKDEFAGKTIRCPKCKNPVQLAEVEFSMNEDRTEVMAAPPPPPAPPPQPLAPPPLMESFEEEEKLAPKPVKAGKGKPPAKAKSVAKDESAEEELVVSREAKGKKDKKKKKKGGMGLMIGVILGVLVLAGGGVGGYLWWQSQQGGPLNKGNSNPIPNTDNTNPNPTSVFKDELPANVPEEKGAVVSALEFTALDGMPVKVADFKGKKHVVLVFLRGIPQDAEKNSPDCSAQAAGLTDNYEEFSKRHAEVLLVFPGKREEAEKFVTGLKETTGKEAIPFPVLLDVALMNVKKLDLALASLEKVDLEADQARPATYLLDKDGKLRYGHEAEAAPGRPSPALLFGQLDAINMPPVP